MIEIVSPAVSTEGLRAAVVNGADAVYAGAGSFSQEEFTRAAEYCRIRGVRFYYALDSLLFDNEITPTIELAVSAVQKGADALIVSDLGLIRSLRRIMPEVPLFGSAKLGISSLDGAKTAASMGLKRITLARELDRETISGIIMNTGIEVEVSVHGENCISFSGQCYFSSVLGLGSCNRNDCNMLCREPFSGSRSDIYPLSQKETGLYAHISELREMGVSSLRIEGSGTRPEYAALTASVYSRLKQEHTYPTDPELQSLQEISSTKSYTDGYFTGKKERMSAGSAPGTADPEKLKELRRTYIPGLEYSRVTVAFTAGIAANEPVSLTAADEFGHTVTVIGQPPEPAFHREITVAEVSTGLRKTGGTPYKTVSVKSNIAPGIFVNPIKLTELRNSALSQLSELRKTYTPPKVNELDPIKIIAGHKEKPGFSISVTQISQITKELIELHPERIYIPAYELNKPDAARQCAAAGIEVAVSLPHFINPRETAKLTALLYATGNAGIKHVLVHNIGQIPYVRSFGYIPLGDYGLNITNSASACAARELGLGGMTLSFEMNLQQIRAVSKETDSEVIVYGRLPLMLTENCVVKNATGTCACTNFLGIEDKRGTVYPIVRESGSCRTIVESAQKLFLADRLGDFSSLGLRLLRLSFTTENPHECYEIAKRYMRRDGAYSPAGFMRGLYYS